MIHVNIENLSEAFGEVHASCRIEFLNYSQRAFSKYGHKQTACKTVEGGYGEIFYQIKNAFNWKYYLLHMQHETDRGHEPLQRGMNCKMFLRSDS